MTSDEYLRRPRGTVVYLDANVLVKGVVRTLVLMCATRSDYSAVWSPYAETEAERHQDERAVKVSALRQRLDIPFVPDATTVLPLVDTDPKDRPILSAASANNARLVVTENVKDFGALDLSTLRLSAVHPDLFLSARIEASAYLATLQDIAEVRKRYPLTPAEIHASEVAANLPRLFYRHQELLGVQPAVPVRGFAKLPFRGVRCVVCSRPLTDDESLHLGVGPECRKHGGM
ncbi:DUF6011 domain-containing protein [Mycobacteroides franklinii]|uniref:DUF6011 domain-containing protein n=1 Tax=Mycobacteroides franklinii TaxID=948102 RepID=UPI000992CD84|nr:DUF6011 domain-containing protein [Mycobacteroides franklinii]